MFVSHLYIFFGEMSIQIPCPFLKIGLFVILLLSWKNSLYALNTNLYQVYDFQIFSHSVVCVFTFLIISFEGPKFFCFYCPLNLFFLLLFMILMSCPRNLCLIQKQRFTSSKSFIVLLSYLGISFLLS